MNNAERHLTNELRRAADDMPPASVALEAFEPAPRRHSARNMLLAVVAAAVAVALPVAAVRYFDRSGSQNPADNATPTGFPSLVRNFPPPTAQTPAPERLVTLSLGALSAGAAPALPYYSDGTIYGPDGRAAVQVAIPKYGSVTSFARFGDGWVVLVQDEGMATEARIYDADGKLVRSFPTQAGSVARGADGSVAVSMEQGQVTLFDAEGKKVRTWKFDGYEPSPVAVLSDGSVVMFGRGWRATTIRALPDGSLQALGLGPVSSVNPANLDLSIGYDCAAVYGTDPPQARWDTCPYLGDAAFSPDGRYLVARSLNGVMTRGKERTKVSPGIGILDARTGAVVVHLQSDPALALGYVGSLAWEDDTHALVMVNSHVGWRILRVGLDGSVEVADAPDLAGVVPDNPAFEGTWR